MKRSALTLAFLATATTGLLHCAAPMGDDTEEAVDALTGAAEEMFVPISNLETSRTKSAKVAKLKIKGAAALQELGRCHQYRLDLDHEIIVCRDDKREIVMDSSYGENFTRWARLRVAGAKDQTFTCKQVSEHEFSPEAYGGSTGHACKPKTVDAAGKALFALVDADPTLDEFATHSVYLPTMWKHTPAETWSGWSKKFAKAMPVGEYVGYGSTTAKKCKVKIAKKGDGLDVSIVGLDASGAETRVQARAELSSAMTYGALLRHGVPQKVSGPARSASVLIASAETETRTDDYYSRNVRIVRFDETPASVEAGHTALYIDDNYCQRLTPGLPAW